MSEPNPIALVSMNMQVVKTTVSPLIADMKSRIGTGRVVLIFDALDLLLALDPEPLVSVIMHEQLLDLREVPQDWPHSPLSGR
jgi:hypothetical protein